jgi:hypothetical protein
MDLCKYNKIFGDVMTGVHSIRIFNIAVIDVLLTILVAYYLSKQYQFDFYKTAAVLFVLGIFLHRIFCVQTTIDKLLFNN